MICMSGGSHVLVLRRRAWRCRSHRGPGTAKRGRPSNALSVGEDAFRATDPARKCARRASLTPRARRRSARLFQGACHELVPAIPASHRRRPGADRSPPLSPSQLEGNAQLAPKQLAKSRAAAQRGMRRRLLMLRNYDEAAPRGSCASPSSTLPSHLVRAHLEQFTPTGVS